MIRSKPEIMPPDWAQDLVRKPTPETQLTAFLKWPPHCKHYEDKQLESFYDYVCEGEQDENEEYVKDMEEWELSSEVKIINISIIFVTAKAKNNASIGIDSIEPKKSRIIKDRTIKSPLFITPPEVGQVEGKIIISKQRIQPITDHNTQCNIGLSKSVSKKYFGSPEAKANINSSNHFIPLSEQRKKADIAPITEDMSEKRSLGNKTGAEYKKWKQRSNSDNQIEIEPDCVTDQPNQLN
ncbi:MAG: hypothetical protein EZS28_024291 [Streblomastix strix]|uniref:Uncharacterized protein n=1 Tax=Streblomastix strix TaxID=222440 RepID=A0A5J4VCL6_9EUKA|nr:MAG: hypothetical protein EZS28_024291 [Streblomastix strix]